MCEVLDSMGILYSVVVAYYHCRLRRIGRGASAQTAVQKKVSLAALWWQMVLDHISDEVFSFQ